MSIFQMVHKVRLRYHRIVRVLRQNMLLGVIPFCHDHLTSSASSTEASVLCHRLFEIVLHERLSYKRESPPIALAPG
jgi:hypothetical protein